MKSDRIKDIVLVIVLGLVSFAVYLNAMQGEFLIDDEAGIQNNPLIHNARAYFANSFKIHPGIIYEVIRVFNWHISKNNTFSYHLTDVVAHVLCVVTLFILLEVLFRNRGLSFLSALIFAVHPIHTEAVSWISAENYVFSSIFFIISLIFYARSSRSIVNFTLAVVFFCICLLAGNAAATLPLMFLFYDLFFREKSTEAKLLKRLRIVTLLSIFVLALVYITTFLVTRNKFMHLIFTFRGPRYLIVILKEFAYYLKLLYLPLARGLYHPFAFNTFDIQKISPLFFTAVACLAVSLTAFFKCRARLAPVSFGIMWFFVTYAPYSNTIPICNIISERYMYLPSAGFAIVTAALFVKAWEVINRNIPYRQILRMLAIGAITLFLGSYAALTVKRNYEYSNILTYWYSNINNFPQGYMVYNNLAGTYYAMGYWDNAIGYCWITLMVNPNQPHVWCNLGMMYRQQGKFKEAEECYQQALKIDKSYFPASLALAEIKKRSEIQK